MAGVELEPYFILFYLSQNLDIQQENSVCLNTTRLPSEIAHMEKMLLYRQTWRQYHFVT